MKLGFKSVVVVYIILAAVPLYSGQSIEQTSESWGEPVEGLQCRLRLSATSPVWDTPLVLIDVRNTSQSYFRVSMSEESGYEVRVDGKFVKYLGAIEAPYSSLAPGRTLMGIHLDLSHEGWRLEVAAGKHTVQVIALLSSGSPPDQRMVAGQYDFKHPLRVPSNELIVAFPKPIIRK